MSDGNGAHLLPLDTHEALDVLSERVGKIESRWKKEGDYAVALCPCCEGRCRITLEESNVVETCQPCGYVFRKSGMFLRLPSTVALMEHGKFEALASLHGTRAIRKAVARRAAVSLDGAPEDVLAAEDEIKKAVAELEDERSRTAKAEQSNEAENDQVQRNRRELREESRRQKEAADKAKAELQTERERSGRLEAMMMKMLEKMGASAEEKKV